MTLATVKTDEDQKSLIEVAQNATDEYYAIGAVSYYHIGMTRDDRKLPSGLYAKGYILKSQMRVHGCGIL